MNTWNFFNPTKITFGEGSLKKLTEIRSSSIAIITTQGYYSRGWDSLLQSILGEKIKFILDSVKPNPSLDDIDVQNKLLKRNDIDTILAIGGGSSIDTAKALSKLYTQSDSFSLSQHFKEHLSFKNASSIPIIAIPTTSGTGAEVTPFGTIWDFESSKKYSISSEDLYPKFSILDPELTYTLSEETTVSSGLDSVSHALESIWNHSATPISLSISFESLKLSLNALPKILKNPKDKLARSQQMQASVLAGIAISQTKTSLAHSISYPLTTHFGLPHGISCSFTLASLFKFNSKFDDGRFEKLSKYLGFNGMQEMNLTLYEFLKEVGCTKYLKKYIPNTEDIFKHSSEMITPERANQNLRKANYDDVKEILYDSILNL